MLELDKEKMMFNQNNGPLEHLAANALALLAGALCVLAAQAYGAWIRRRGQVEDQQLHAAQRGKEAA